MKLSLENQERADTEVAGEILRGFRGVKMSLVDRNAEAATVELQGLADVAAGASKGRGVLLKQAPPRVKQPIDNSDMCHVLYINKASREDLRSSYSNQASLYKAAVEAECVEASPKAQVVASARGQQSDLGSKNTERLPTEPANKTFDRARELASSSHYYSGAAGPKKRTLPQTSPKMSQPYHNAIQRIEVLTQGANTPTKIDHEELLNFMNA